jgi:Heparinase II/III-like protein/Heparinase II/III N-terminus
VRLIPRLARMDRAEIAWRAGAAARIAIERAQTCIGRADWNRHDLLRALALQPALAAVRTALAGGHWNDAHRELAAHFTQAPQRFVIHAAMKESLRERIRAAFPDSATQAAARADRILAGEYDLLGYRGLRFSVPAQPARPAVAALPAWNYDPVHNRRAPETFWSSVPFLDNICGDHKIVWELNRHQHWMTLGRAYWLTGDTEYCERFVTELETWMAANPPLIGINWASMLELAFRSLSWLWALHMFGGPARAGREVPDATAAETPWLVDLLLGIDRQLAHVERNLSHYYSPNTHLIGEALALYAASRAVPELAASARRAAVGRRVLVAEIDRQIAADGGHCERSAHYHRYTLDFYLLALAIARVTDDAAAAEFEHAADRLASAARLLADDNGRLPHLGDDDGGSLFPITGGDVDDARGSLAVAAALLNNPGLQIGETPEEVLWMVGAHHEFHIPHSTFHVASGALPETGYYVSRSAEGHHLVIDGGPHGYRNGGHSHADALSLTFAWQGVPLLIDPGTGCYTTDAELRDRMRSAALHNTLTLDGRSPSVPDGAFHWKQTADARVNRWVSDPAFDYFDGAHDGYAPIEHRRQVLMRHGDLLVVGDFTNTTGSHVASTHWHIDPHWSVAVSGRRVTLTRKDDPRAQVVLVVAPGVVETFCGDETTGLGWFSPVYGRLEKTTALRVTDTRDGPIRMAAAFGLDPTNQIVDVAWISDTTLRIRRQRTVDEIGFDEMDQECVA